MQHQPSFLQIPKRRTFLPLRPILLALVALAWTPAAHATVPHPPVCANVTIATRNVYFGTDLAPVIGAPDETQFLLAVGTAWGDVQASNIPARASRIAQEIALDGPSLVGLQEVAQWWEGPSPQTLTLQYDYLQSILDSLGKLGLHYQLVKANDDLDMTVPGVDANGNLLYVRLLDRTAMIAKSGLPPNKLTLANAQGQTFSTLLTLPLPGLSTVVTVPRRWISVDAPVGRVTFRFITTQLESFYPPVNEAQGAELLTGPAATTLPVVMAADFNSSANGGPDDIPTYGDLIGAGFQDGWANLHPYLVGDTCCQEADLQNVLSELYERIDLVLTDSDAASPSSIFLVGSFPWSKTRTSPPLWSSDHAGVVATLRLTK
jgi:hypothetical protein